MGGSLWLLSAGLSAALVFLALSAGELLNVSALGFEVIFPFYAAIAVGEWGKTRADDNYDAIAAQTGSVFSWTAVRYAAVMEVVNLSAVAGMIPVTLIRGEMSFAETLLSYCPTAFLLSSLAMAAGTLSRREHTASLVCGLVWLAELMAGSLLRFPAARCIYLFACFSGIRGGEWAVNKGFLCALGLVIWCGTAGRSLQKSRFSCIVQVCILTSLGLINNITKVKLL